MTEPASNHLPATIGEVIANARSSLDPGAWQWAESGAGTGLTAIRNVEAIHSRALIPHVGRDVSIVDASSTHAGTSISLPVFLAPVAALGIFDDDDAVAAAKAAATAGTVAHCALLTSSNWSDVAATAPGRHVFQIYVFGDRAWLLDLVRKVEEIGFGSLSITMDSARVARRDASIEAGYVWKPTTNTVNLDGWDSAFRPAFTWEDLEWLCSSTDLPVMAKGILNGADARRAVEAGAAAVYVSNHGGRMVDHALSSIDALEDVVDAVGGETEVVVDGGFTRGSEILMAIALGASSVGLGRLQCWALASGGTSHLERTLEILDEEIRLTMANLGCTGLDELTPDQVRRV